MTDYKPKILFLDIETNGVNGFKADLAFALCVGYSWIDSDETHCVGLDDFGKAKYKKTPYDDKQLITFIHSLLMKADVLAGHYLKYFDFPFLQTRMAIHGLPPIKHLKILDSCDIGRYNFKLSSNRLKNMCLQLGTTEKKMEKNEGWPLWWFKTAAGDLEAMQHMKEYCAQDVVSNKELFLRLRPFWPVGVLGAIIHKKQNPLPKGVTLHETADYDLFDRLVSSTIIRTKNACWDWQSSEGSHGYGDFKFKGTHYLAHRAAYTLFKGTIPDGMNVDHLCYNKKCCNPAHLVAMSPEEHLKRAHADGKYKNRDLSMFLAGGIKTRFKKGDNAPKGKDSHLTKIKDDATVEKIRSDNRPHKTIAEEYGVSRSTISRIKKGQTT